MIPAPLPTDRELDIEVVYAEARKVTSLNFADHVPALCRLLAESRAENDRLRAELDERPTEWPVNADGSLAVPEGYEVNRVDD